MSEKNRKKSSKPPKLTEQPQSSKPAAEETVFIDASDRVANRESDEFGKRYRRAVAEAAMPTNRLLNDLSRETRADKYNFIGAFIPIILIIILAISFAFISRGDIEELFLTEPSVKTVLNGSYTENLNSVYESTLPFSTKLKTIGAMLGFCDKPTPDVTEPDGPGHEIPNNIPSNDDVIVPEEDVIVPEVTDPVDLAAEPVITTPFTTEEVTPATTGETEPEEYDTNTMYATATLNIRSGPSTEDTILGQYNRNDPVEVIEILDNGWAAVLFDGRRAYAHSSYLSKNKTHRSSTEATTTEDTTEEAVTDDAFPEAEITDLPQDDDSLTASSEDEPVVTEEAGTGEALSDDDNGND